MGSPANCKQHGREFWRVLHYRHNHSAFNGYHRTPSDYSKITCIAPMCFITWYTKAAYVEKLPFATDEEVGPRGCRA